MNIWADYSAGRPSGMALRAAGITGVVRYVALGSSGKRLTTAELTNLRDAGLDVWGVAESTTDRSNAGYAAGLSDAQAVLADPAAATLPMVFASNDQTPWSQYNLDYVRGFASVLGRNRTGVYGFGPFLAAVRNLDLVAGYWQAGHPPDMTGTRDYVHLWQRQGTSGDGSCGPATPTTAIIDGVTCDLSNSLRGLSMTTLDDAARSYYVGPNGQQSTVTQPLYCYILAADASGWFLRQAVDGEQRRPYPDGVTRNIVEALEHIVARLIGLESLAAQLSADDAALLSAIQDIGPGVDVDSDAVAAALVAAGLPDQVARALATLIATRLAADD